MAENSMIKVVAHFHLLRKVNMNESAATRMKNEWLEDQS